MPLSHFPYISAVGFIGYATFIVLYVCSLHRLVTLYIYNYTGHLITGLFEARYDTRWFRRPWCNGHQDLQYYNKHYEQLIAKKW